MNVRTTLFLLAVVAAASSAHAEMVIGPDGQIALGPDGNPLRRTALEASCTTSIQRFCPELLDPSGQTRNEVLCLRPYRTSLPPPCRKAVDAGGR